MEQLTDRVWHGDAPVFVLVASPGGEQTIIDVDEKDWLVIHRKLMRAEGTWHLFQKDGGYLFSLTVHDGEQPYFSRKSIVRSLADVMATTVAYGIGKKRKDGHTDRLWWLPGGQICAGDDVYDFGTAQNIQRLGS